ncbi:MAG: PTS sugar transporter subunit IIB [Eubacteriales bacterium]|nr:PTS sugar transporter subunit IIB [Eubacteriales bacterium]
MKIKKIMCCCGSGLGSSLMVRINVEKVLKNLGVSGVTVEHSSLSDVSANSADLFVVGKDLETFTKSFPKVITLDNIVSIPELEEKMKKVLEEE